MVTPANFAAAVLPLGKTTTILDPHEIANSTGVEGVKYVVNASAGLPLPIYVTVASCVPAVPGRETSGATFGPAEVQAMLRLPRVVAVAEVMDYMGVIQVSCRMMDIVETGLRAGVNIQ